MIRLTLVKLVGGKFLVVVTMPGENGTNDRSLISGVHKGFFSSILSASREGVSHEL